MSVPLGKLSSLLSTLLQQADIAEEPRAASIESTNPAIGTDRIIQFEQYSGIHYTSVTIIGGYYERSPLSRGLQGRNPVRL